MRVRRLLLRCAVLASAAGCGAHAVLADAGPEASSLAASLVSSLAWAAGLLCGMALMIALKVDWARLPEQTWIWLKAQRHHLRWAAASVVSLGVLLFY